MASIDCGYSVSPSARTSTLVISGDPALHCFQSVWFGAGMTTPPGGNGHGTHTGSDSRLSGMGSACCSKMAVPGGCQPGAAGGHVTTAISESSWDGTTQGCRATKWRETEAGCHHLGTWIPPHQSLCTYMRKRISLFWLKSLQTGFQSTVTKSILTHWSGSLAPTYISIDICGL